MDKLTAREAVAELVVRVGSEEREYRHCENCGSRLSEWFVDSEFYGQPGMKCQNCGTISEHKEHPSQRLKPWARQLIHRLRHPTEEDDHE